MVDQRASRCPFSMREMSAWGMSVRVASSVWVQPSSMRRLRIAAPGWVSSARVSQVVAMQQTVCGITHVGKRPRHRLPKSGCWAVRFDCGDRNGVWMGIRHKTNLAGVFAGVVVAGVFTVGSTNLGKSATDTAVAVGAASAGQQLSCDARTVFPASVLSESPVLLALSTDPVDQAIVANLRASNSDQLQAFGASLTTPVRILGTTGNHRSYLMEAGQFASVWTASVVTMQVDRFSGSRVVVCVRRSMGNGRCRSGCSRSHRN